LQKKSATDIGKSESITFRLDNEIIKNLRHEAKQQDISTNTLVSHVLKEHIKWHSNASKAGFIAVRRSLIMNLMSLLSEQEIVSVAENVAKTTNKDSILLLEKEYTLKSALEFLENWMKVSGYVYRHEETYDGPKRHLYVIQHDMGMKWSVYLANLYQFLFDEISENNKRIEFEKTENTLAFRVNCN
jgi:predicted AlkP superfamily phosphohydrolase/phosphomutase